MDIPGSRAHDRHPRIKVVTSGYNVGLSLSKGSVDLRVLQEQGSGGRCNLVLP
jgi:hypothetical protein